jgi:hypothetical protein
MKQAQKLESLTLEEVNAAIRKYLSGEKSCMWPVITHDSEAKPLAQSLKQNTASHMSYSNIVKEGLSKNILDKDRKAAVFPLDVKKVEIVESKDMFID